MLNKIKMKKLDLTQLSIEELLVKQKKRKSSFTIFKFVIGMMLGIAIYSTIVKGFSFSTFMPVFFLPLAFTVKKQFNEIQKEVAA
jgi:hypothetical protein